MPSSAPRVFISYSHDTPEHVNGVLALADRLRGEGVDARLDQYEVSPPHGWQLWMEEEIESANFVLVVATETYERRRRGREEKRKGLGVRFEGAILSQTLYDNALHNETCIPVFFSTEAEAHIPVFLKSATRYDLSGEEGYKALYRHLTGQPAVEKPALGKLKELAPRTRHKQFDRERSYTDERSCELAEALGTAREEALSIWRERILHSNSRLMPYFHERHAPLLEHFYVELQLAPKRLPGAAGIDREGLDEVRPEARFLTHLLQSFELTH